MDAQGGGIVVVGSGFRAVDGETWWDVCAELTVSLNFLLIYL